MRRRNFIKATVGAVIAWPLMARAQTRRIGVLMNLAADDPQSAKEISAFLDGLKERGWTPGGNLQIEYRWGAGTTSLTASMLQNWSRLPLTYCWWPAARLSAYCKI